MNNAKAEEIIKKVLSIGEQMLIEESPTLANRIIECMELYLEEESEGQTIKGAKKMLREKMDEGAKCPCCNQNVKMYRWKISGKVARTLIDFYYHRGTWVHPLDDLKVNNGDYAKLRHFGLIASDAKRTESKKASGKWMITEKGIQFVERKITIPEKVKLYNGEKYGFEGDQITIEDALGKKFNYNELMNDNGESKEGNDEAI